MEELDWTNAPMCPPLQPGDAPTSLSLYTVQKKKKKPHHLNKPGTTPDPPKHLSNETTENQLSSPMKKPSLQMYHSMMMQAGDMNID